VPFRPLGILFESALLLGDLARSLIIERFIGHAAEERQFVRHSDCKIRSKTGSTSYF
jgi:hypothetical protein